MPLGLRYYLITSKQSCARFEVVFLFFVIRKAWEFVFKARVFSDVRRRDWSHDCLYLADVTIALFAYVLHVVPIFQYKVASFSLSLEGLDSEASHLQLNVFNFSVNFELQVDTVLKCILNVFLV
jgi:hypothetical protein